MKSFVLLLVLTASANAGFVLNSDGSVSEQQVQAKPAACKCGENCPCQASTAVRYVSVCENGTCRLVPVSDPPKAGTAPSVTPAAPTGPCGLAIPAAMPGPGHVVKSRAVVREGRTYGLVGRFFFWRR